MTLALLLNLQATTRSAVAGWATVIVLAVVLVIRYEFWPGGSRRHGEENEP